MTSVVIQTIRENFDEGKRNLVQVSKEFDPAVTVQSEVTN